MFGGNDDIDTSQDLSAALTGFSVDDQIMAISQVSSEVSPAVSSV